MNKVVRMIRRYLLWWLVLAGMMSELRDVISKDTSDLQMVRTLLRITYFASFIWIGGVIFLGLLTRLVQAKMALFKRCQARFCDIWTCRHFCHR